eukprot:Hpha_TRINITY_DN15001_c0_g1::TRINITY_DN15001_c0_g1_i5::g.124134::m.124134
MQAVESTALLDNGAATTNNKGALQTMLMLCATVGSGMLCGLYYIFSTCVMPALDQQSAHSAIETMNAINVIIVNPSFMVIFMGTPIVCLALLVQFCINRSGKEAYNARDWFVLIGCLALLFGEFGVTVTQNVPRNDKLAVYGNGETEGQNDGQAWKEYYQPWVFWNTVRAWFSLLATALFAYTLTKH